MAHILYKLGAAALKPRMRGDELLPPLIRFEEAMRLRAQFYKEKQPWPYEDIVPGPAKEPAGAEEYLKRRAENQERKQKRLKEIQEAMTKMPSLVSKYKESRRMDWSEVDVLDHLTMTRTAIRQKYNRKRLSKQV